MLPRPQRTFKIYMVATRLLCLFAVRLVIVAVVVVFVLLKNMCDCDIDPVGGFLLRSAAFVVAFPNQYLCLSFAIEFWFLLL